MELRSVDDEGVAGFGVGVARVSGDVEERGGGVAWSMVVLLLSSCGFCEGEEEKDEKESDQGVRHCCNL